MTPLSRFQHSSSQTSPALTHAGTHTSTPIQPLTDMHTYSKIPHPPTQTRTGRHMHTHSSTHAHTCTHSDAYAYISTCKPTLSRSLTLNRKHTLSLFYLVVTQNLSLSHTTVISQDHKPTKGCLLEKE